VGFKKSEVKEKEQKLHESRKRIVKAEEGDRLE
jgi:hypothetical protein